MRRWLYLGAIILGAGNPVAADVATVDAQHGGLHFDDRGGLLVIMDGERPLVGYQYGHRAPPTGIDAVFGRSGFIHPLWSPHGQVLTRIHPESHYHHYGIWNPWTRVRYEGSDYDLWNLGDRKGTVRFAGFVNRHETAGAATVAVHHEHVAFVSPGVSRVILTELQSIRVHGAGPDSYRVDLVIELAPATDRPVELPEYRYGGFGWRATAEWHAGNSEILASEGHDRSNADNTAGRWYLAQGEVGGEYAGAVVMSHPANFNHPEPMRIWPPDNDTRGEVFTGFAPTRNTSWLLEPGRTYIRMYRFLVYNGRLGEEEAEAAWREFAEAPVDRDVAAARGLFPGIEQGGEIPR